MKPATSCDENFESLFVCWEFGFLFNVGCGVDGCCIFFQCKVPRSIVRWIKIRESGVAVGFHRLENGRMLCSIAWYVGVGGFLYSSCVNWLTSLFYSRRR